jgi:type I restriction enzyme, S subunit
VNGKSSPQKSLASLISLLDDGASFDSLRTVVWEWAISGLLSPLGTRGWVAMRFGDLGVFSGGATPSKNNRSYWGGKIPWVSPKDMKCPVITATEDTVTEEALSSGRLKLLPANAVLIVVRSGILRRTVPVAIAGVPCTINQDMKALVVGSSLSHSYAQLLVKGLERRILSEFVKGGMTVQSVMWDALADCEVRLPPISEQNRILTRVDQLLSLGASLEAQCAARHDVRTHLTRSAFKALELSPPNSAEFHAARDRLVNHFDSIVMHAEDLEVARESSVEMAARGLLSRTTESVAGAKSRAVSESGLLELPAGWEWSTVGDLVTSMDAGWSPQCANHATSSDDEWGVLKTTSVQRAEFLPEHHKALPKALAPRPELCVRAGDVLITRAGPTARVGVACCVVKVRERLMLSDKIIRVRFREDLVDPRFAALVLNAGASSAFLRASQSGMDLAQVNISQDRLRRTPIPLAPLETQRETVAAFTRLERHWVGLEAALRARRNVVSRLATSLAAHAAGVGPRWSDEN